MRTSSLPIHTVIFIPLKVMVGQVSLGTLSRRLEQAREAADLGVHVLLAALDDESQVSGWR